MFDFDVLVDRTGTNSLKWDSAGDGQLPMGLADMDLRTAPVVLEALAGHVEHGVFGYTGVGRQLTDAVTGWVKHRRGLVVQPDWIVFCPGVMPSIAFLLRSWLDPGDGVVVQTPAFGPIPDVIEANDLSVVESPLLMVDGQYEMDLDDFRAKAERDDVRAFVLCSPHNPSGKIWTRAVLEEVAAIAAANGVLVISDEIHGEVTYPWAEFVSFASVASSTVPHAICFGPSKAFNLPSLRTSVVVVADDALRAAMRYEIFKVNEGFGVSGPGSVALTAAFTEGEPWLAALALHLERNLNALTEALHAETPIRVVRPDASYLVWLDCTDVERGDAGLIEALAGAGVIVEPGTSFGPRGSGFVRLNIGTTHSRVVEASRRVAAAFSG